MSAAINAPTAVSAAMRYGFNFSIGVSLSLSDFMRKILTNKKQIFAKPDSYSKTFFGKQTSHRPGFVKSCFDANELGRIIRSLHLSGIFQLSHDIEIHPFDIARQKIGKVAL